MLALRYHTQIHKAGEFGMLGKIDQKEARNEKKILRKC